MLKSSRIFLILIFMLLPGFAHAALSPDNPADIPDILQQGIDQKDSAQVMRHLNLDSIVTSIIDEQLDEINQGVINGELLLNQPLLVALASLNTGNATTRRTATIFLTSELNKFLIYGVDSGNFAGDPLPESQRMQMDGGVFNLLNVVSMKRKEFYLTKILRQDEKKALISTELFDAGTKRSYPLELDMAKENGTWVITKIANLQALIPQLK